MLEGKRVAILVADGFEQSELTGPRQALDEAGATTSIVSPVQGQVQGWQHFDHADKFKVDVPLEAAPPDQLDALLLPDGVVNPDQLRVNPQAMRFVEAFVQAGKPIAAVCNGPRTLIEAGAAKGRHVTSWPSLRTDLDSVWAQWIDREVVVYRGLISSRKPANIPAFNFRMIEEFGEGSHQQRGTPQTESAQ